MSSIQMKTGELSVPNEPMPVVRMEGLSLLTTNSSTAVNMDSATTQFISFPILPDGTFSGMDNQNIIFARSADGNTILVDASQLTVLTEQTIPVYDGTNLFQVTSEAPLESSGAFTKPTEDQPYIETVQTENTSAEPGPSFANDEILPPDRKGPFKCAICCQEFSVEKQLQRHYKLHAEDKPHRCEECDASFNKLTNLILHQATHRTADPLCPICKKKFTRMASLKAHLMLHEIEENLICTECGDEFSTQFRLNKHVQEHLEELAMDKSFTCRTCKKGFKKLSHLREHSKIHYKIKASLHRRIYKKNIDRSSFCHKCYFCGKLFQKPSQLVRHNRIHTGERPFKCNVCGKAFNQKGALLIHMVKHTGERPHCCEFCPASFAQKGNLRNHIRRVHTLLTMDDSEGVHKCHLCTCVFRKLGTLNAHMSRAHSVHNTTLLPDNLNNSQELNVASTDVNDKNNSVNPLNTVINELIEMSKQTEAAQSSEQKNQENLKNIVIDSYVNSDILRQALENSGLAPSEQITDKTKPYIMTVADTATGTTNTHLMRNVGGVRYYQCMYCSKEFKKPSDLVRHIRIHTHEKPYKCDQCYRAFAVKSTLSAHVRTHSGTKDFQCEHCKKMFATSGSLKVHLLLHTGAKPFSCTICHKGFRTSGHRNNHMLSHKNEKTRKGNSKKLVKLDDYTNIDVSDVALQEPILITDAGYMQQIPKNVVACLNDGNPERPYLCDYCPKRFKKSSHLKQHVRSHTGEKPYRCLECDKSFVSNGVLKSHLRTHTGVKAFNCNICDATFTTNGSVKRHMAIHRDDRPYMCPYCQKTFKTNMNCKKHMKTHRYELALGLASGVTVTVISNNGSNQENQKNISHPSATHDPEQVIENTENSQSVLPTCVTPSFETDPDENPVESESQLSQHLSQEVFNTQTGMIEQAEIIPQVHMFDQGQTNIFTLSSSDFTDNNLTLQLENNERNILPEPVGDNLLSQSSNVILKIPERDIVSEKKTKESRKRKRSKKPYKCEQCSRIFKKSSYLKQHIMTTHTQERPFRCSKCGKMFRSKANLDCHQQTHENSHQFECKKCPSVFTTKSSLQRHMTLHDAERPYHCSYCCESFRTKELYKSHLKTYHFDDATEENNVHHITIEDATEVIVDEGVDDVNPYHTKWVEEKEKNKAEYLPKYTHACAQCPKSFKKQSDLVRHTRIHTGEKPYGCETCGKCFTVKSTLDSHIKTHTGEKNFSCHVCCSFFATKGSLKVHMRLHTGVRPFKCPHCDLTFRTSGHRKSHLASHFKDKSNRGSNRKKRTSESIQSEPVVEENQDFIQPSVVSEEIITMPAEACPEIQIPVNQDDIQLQIPNLVGQNIQIVDPNSVSKSIQIDPVILQHLHQNSISINVTLTQDQLNKLIDMNHQQPTLSIESNDASSGAYTLNPLIINQLGYAIPTHNESQVTESVPVTVADINLAKNVAPEAFQNGSLIDTQALTLDSNNLCTGINMDNAGNGAANTSDGTPQYQDNNILINQNQNVSQEFTCSVCFRVFRTVGQLNAHEAVHKVTKYIYHCEVCKKSFKKKHQFQKHMQLHKQN